MNALEIAECFDLYAIDHTPEGWPAIRQDTLNKTAALLRRQHETIKQLREALIDCKYGLEGARIWGGMEWTYNPLHAYKYLPLRDRAEQALKDTEEFQ